MTKITSPQDIPSGHHYAIFIFDDCSYIVPADETSKRWPGHGYPEHSNTIPTYKYYTATDKEALNQTVEMLIQGGVDLSSMVITEVQRKFQVTRKTVYVE